jgi:hypothetical protein
METPPGFSRTLRLSPQAAALVSCALLSACVLLAEVSLTRLLSVTLYYHYAFAVVALALLGLGWGARGWRESGSGQELGARRLDACAGTATTLLLCEVALLALPWRPYVRPTPAAAEAAAGLAGWLEQAGRWMAPLQLVALALLVAVPFVCAGRALAGLFARARGQAAGMRAAEAVGAALAGAAAAAAIGGLGAPSSLLAAALLASLAGLLQAGAPGEVGPAAPRRRRLALGGGASLLMLAAAAGVLSPPAPVWAVSRLALALREAAPLCFVGAVALVIELTGVLTAPRRRRRALLQALGLAVLLALQLISPPLRVRYVKGGHLEAAPLREAWTLDSRVALHSGNVFTDGPEKVNFAWGAGLSMISPVIDQLQIQIDALSATPVVRLRERLDDLDFLRYDITALAFHAAEPEAEVLVIGSGGGRDLLTALLFGARRVTGIESNPHIVRWVCEDYAAFTGRLCRNDKVRMERSEARAWLARAPERFDLIQVAFADTGAAGAAGAYALTENFLYTREAMRAYLEHLTDAGMLSFSHYHPRNPTPAIERLFLTALETLEEQGATSAGAHLFLATTAERASPVATLIVRRQPFTEQTLQPLVQGARQMGFAILHPQAGPAGAAYAGLVPAEARARRVAEHVADIRPSEDDRPFFFLTSRGAAPDPLPPASSFAPGAPAPSGSARPLAFHDNAAALLRPIGVSALLAALILAFVPSARGGGSPRRTAFFFLSGFGFVAAELALAQRLSLTLGGPGTALTVILAALMASSAAGAALAQAAPDGGSASWMRAAGAAAALSLLGIGAALPWLSGGALGFAPAARLALVLGTLAPAGLLMGLLGGGGMRAVDGAEGGPRASAWGASALGAAAAGAVGWWLAVRVGYSAVLVAAAAAYGAAAVLAPHLGREQKAEAGAGPEVRG